MKVVPINELNGKLADFDLFWAIYPKKVAKLDAMRAWEGTKKMRPGIEEIIAAVNRLAVKCPDMQFFPHPATWLRGGRWMDE